MALITVNDARVAFAGHAILEGVNLSLNEGETVGLIGANGSGKTTILRLIAGTMQPDSGRVELKRGLRVGYLEQEPNLPEDDSVHDAALSAFSELLDTEREMRNVEHELASAEGSARHALLARLGRLQEQFQAKGGYDREARTASVLAGVGFTQEEFSRPVSVLSGGEKARLALARLLLRDAEALLLDEPTNHLDLAGIEWLEGFLTKKFKGAALVVSHDRLFLDRTVRRILELDECRIEEYPGNYTKYFEVRALRRLERRRLFDKQQAYIAKQEEFIRRYHAAQRAKEAQGRQKMLDRLERLEAPTERREMAVRFDPAKQSAELCIRVEELGKHFKNQQPLFDNLNLEIYRGDRVGIIGPNGAGKTTLLKTLLGTEQATDGGVEIGRHVQVGYLPQRTEGLFTQATPLDEVWERNRKLDEVQARSLLGRFLFSDDEAHKPVKDLSGGERTRLALACLMVERPNLLVLDEPTNHLDIASCEALEEAIKEFDGTVVMVSHDRYLINRVANKLVVLDGRGGARVILGNYETYERLRDTEAPPPVERNVPKPPPAPIAKPRKKLSKNRLAKLEKDISALEQEKMQVEQQLADPALYTDPQKAKTVPRRYEEICREIEGLYAEWAEAESADSE